MNDIVYIGQYNTTPKSIFDVDLFGSHSTNQPAAFLYGYAEKHDLSRALFLDCGFDYQTVVDRLRLNSRHNYTN